MRHTYAKMTNLSYSNGAKASKNHHQVKPLDSNVNGVMVVSWWCHGESVSASISRISVDYG